ncbi:creatininase family protein [Aquibacillus koreensis]|uniref:Creatininase family protein n=1 Tax=Aquibacillus koreensis TaxID=279446 RepID=A0A9X4AKA1_9BACI|nr:creatininase family protein [Aquibacillus koreensis]MCT2537789.1 creatininase family protein [Aquibacillus koreensis]MDC3421178.1 creatininase family protein [Aquibacillus koreensis]
MQSDRFKGTAFHDRFFARLSTEEVKALPKEDALIVLPIGAVEQHGPHMPIYTDTLIAEGVLTEAFEHFTDDHNIWMLPPLPYGKSTEHLGMAGTLTLSAETLQAVVMDIAKSVRDSGFKRLVLFNSHGGNHDLLNMISREVRIETGMMIFRLNASDGNVLGDLIPERERQFGIHGGDVETSMVLDMKQDWVHAHLSPTEFVQLPVENKHLYLKGSCYFAWVIEDISTTGMAGDATKATVEKGQEINRRAGAFVAEALIEMSMFNIDELKRAFVKG